MADRIGVVSEIWRYPVKSMEGERVDPGVAGERGLAGDRGWAVIDAETGKVVSAKHPKLWLKMLECQASYVEEPGGDGSATPVRITLPSGREVMTDDPDRDALLSEALGRPVTMASSAPEGAAYDLSQRDADGLEADAEQLTQSQVGLFAPPGTFFDTSTLHVIPTSSFEALARAHPDGRWERRRFRPNVVVELDAPPEDGGFAEAGWVGHSLRLGESVRAAVMAQMPRCVMTTLPQGDLPRDPLILRTLAQENRVEMEGYGSFACVGVLSNVSAPGTVAVGDEVSLG